MRRVTRLGMLWATAGLMLCVGGCEQEKPLKHNLQGGLQPIRMELDIDRQVFANAWRFKVQMDQNHKHLAYRETLNVGARDQLVVFPGAGEKPVTLTGKPIRAEYFHVGRLLVVHEGPKGLQQVYYFAQPRRWFTTPRAAAKVAPRKTATPGR